MDGWGMGMGMGFMIVYDDTDHGVDMYSNARYYLPALMRNKCSEEIVYMRRYLLTF